MNLIKNLFSLSYYTSVLTGTKKFRPALAILILSLLLSIKPSIFIYTDVYPVARNLENKVITLINEIFPSELEIKIKNGTVSSNVTEPYYVTARRETIENALSLKKDTQTSSSKVRLLAIDTKGKADDFEQYQSFGLLTENSLVYYRDGKINIQTLRDIKEMTINKQSATKMVKDFINKYNINNLINIGIFIVPLFIFIGVLISQSVLLFLLSIATYIIIRIEQIKAGFGSAYRYTTVVAFIPILVWNILSLIPKLTFDLSSASSLLTIIILSIVYLGIKSIKNLS